MTKFVECTIDKVKWPYIGYQYNHPVNIELCTSLKKVEEHSGYGDTYPSIKFEGCNITWYFNTEKDRDKNLQILLDKFK